MMKTNRRQWLLAGAAIIVAAGVGFGAARMTAPKPAATPAVPEAYEEQNATDGEPEGLVEMDAAKIRTAGIEIVQTQGGGLASEVVAQGAIEAQPNGEAVLAARADGVVIRINRRLGDQVSAGEAVGVIESREAAGIAAEGSSARARAVAARQAFEREQRLFKAGVSPRQDLEAAQAARAEAEAEVRRTQAASAAARVSADGRSVAVVSPISGRLTASPAVLGAYVAAGAELFRVADVSRIEVRAAVPAADAGRVAAGDAARIETPSGAVAARVRSITPALDDQSRSATVVLTLTGDATGLRPGQAVRARISTKVQGPSDRVVLPEEAVQNVEGKDVVYVRNAKGFMATPVTVGTRSAGRVEISQGVTPGQAVAGRNAFLLKAEGSKGDAEHGH